MYSIVFLILSSLIIIVIGFWVGSNFSNKILPTSKIEFQIRDALKALTNGNIEVWEQFKIFNSDWDNIISDYNLSNCNLSGTNFKGIILKNVKFIQSNLDSADFSYTSMENVCFDEASLKNSNFLNSKILKSTFNSSFLINSDFSNCELNAVSFNLANLQNVNFNHTKGFDLSFDKANIKKASFLYANIDADIILTKENTQNPPKFQKEKAQIKDVINKIYKNPTMVYDLNPIIMEDVIAELFHFMGYTVQKSPIDKDEGYDLILNKKLALGEMTYFVEIKRYSPNKKIGIELIRMAYGIIKTNNANCFIIVTTSSFTQDAIEFSKQFKQIKLIDYDKLMVLLKKYYEQIPKTTSTIKVIGVGGGGSNAVQHMYNTGISGVDFIICNTDRQALESNSIPIKIQLGKSGLGTGANLQVARDAAIENEELIKATLEGAEIVFIAAGMGGGTGTGASPIVASIAREMGILTIGIVSIPFLFEGEKRKIQAIEGIGEMYEYVDTILIINNEFVKKLHEDNDLTLNNAFTEINNLLMIAVKGIAEIIRFSGPINNNINDVKMVMRHSGSAFIGYGMAVGNNRAIEAIRKSLDSSFLFGTDIQHAKNILLNISYGMKEITMDEVSIITSYLQKQIRQDVPIIWGVTQDESLGEEINITIIATGAGVNFDKKATSNQEDSLLLHSQTENSLSFDKEVISNQVLTILKE